MKERHLSLTIRLLEDGQFEVDLYDNETGDCLQIPGNQYKYGEHPEFDTAIGEEICGWVNFMIEEGEYEKNE